MKNFFKNKPFIISNGTGIPGDMDFTIDKFQGLFTKGVQCISLGISKYNNEVIVVPDIYNSKIEMNNPILLNELLIEMPDDLFCLNILEKNEKAASLVGEIIGNVNAEERILVRSIYKKNLKAVKALLPGIAVSFSLMDIVGFYALYKTGLLPLKKKFSADAIISTEMIGTSYFANPGLINNAKQKGLMIYIIGAKSEAEIEKLIAAGVDGFISSDIENLLKILSKLKINN